MSGALQTEPPEPRRSAGHHTRGRDKVSRGLLRVLIVDDDADSADTMAAYLALHRCEVMVVYDAVDLISRAVEFKPELVFLDLVMPALDGYQAARQLRAIPSLSGIKIVALTGLTRPADQKKARDAGCDDYLIKPTEPAEIYRLIDGLLNGTAQG